MSRIAAASPSSGSQVAWTHGNVWDFHTEIVRIVQHDSTFMPKFAAYISLLHYAARQWHGIAVNRRVEHLVRTSVSCYPGIPAERNLLGTMATQYISATQSKYGLWCYFVFMLRALAEIAGAIARWPFKRRTAPEVPSLTCVDTPFNRAVSSRCPALARFLPLWWASGPHAQTMVMASLPPPPGHEYRREWLLLPDRVQVGHGSKEEMRGDAKQQGGEGQGRRQR